jgi:steroid delta-isomerase-like uncharacterized protein
MPSIDQVHRQTQSAFNRRDWDVAMGMFASDATYTDHARRETMHGPDEIMAYFQSFTDAFSDAHIDDAEHHHVGDVSMSQFIGKGTQDGALGPFPPSDRWAETPYCEILHFDDQGRVVTGELYYDLFSMLVQLGHLPGPER